MRCATTGLLLCLLLGACKSTDKPRQPEKSTASANAGHSRKPAPIHSSVTPVNILSGRIVLVNRPLRYVVVDFGVSQLPRPDQRLDVYRAGNKVGEVRISNQSSVGNVAADIMVGEAKDGDEVRGVPGETAK